MNFKFWKKEKREQQQEEVSTITGVGLNLFKNAISSLPTMRLSSVFAAVEIISNSVAEIPIDIKTRKDNQTNIVDDHPLYHIFDNCIQTKFNFMKMLIVDMLLYGNGFAYIERDNNGRPFNLIYLTKDDCQIEYNQTSRTLYYKVRGIKGKVEPINIIHLMKNSKDGVKGIGVLEYAIDSVNLSKYTEKAAQNYFGSGCHLAGVLSTSSPRLTKDQRESIRQAWNEAHGQLGTGMAILEAGMTYQSITSNSRDSQLLDTRLFNLQDIARFFNINPVLLGDLSHSSYSTIEASLLEFVTHTLFPYITLIENEFTRKLILPSEASLFIDLDDNFILRSDKTSQANYLSTLKNAGIITINEARHQLGLNPMEGCDVLMVNFTNIEDNIINKDKDDTPDKQEEQDDTPDKQEEKNIEKEDEQE